MVFLTLVAGEAAPADADDGPPHAGAALFPLLGDLESDEEGLRISALLAMRELGPVAWPAVPALIDALSDPSIGVRKAAAGALGGIGAAAERSVPALGLALGDPHRFVRSWAAMALFEIGPAARPATDALIQMLEEDRSNLRGRAWCASALPQVGAEPVRAVPVLVRALALDESEEVRSVAVLSIQKYGVDAARLGASEALVDALLDPHWKVRGNAACALPEMGDRARGALSALAGRLRDEAPYVRGCAAQALGTLVVLSEASERMLSEASERMLSELEALLRDDDAHVRRLAGQALARLRGQSEPGLPAPAEAGR